MAISVVMPALEMAQETGKLVAWRKKEGEHVSKGEILLEIETDKAVMEIESPGDGTLAAIKITEGAVVPVGQTIAWLLAPGELPPEVVPSESGRQPITPSAHSSLAEPHTPAQAEERTGKISPKARRLARERGIDVDSLRGTGPDGALVAADIVAVSSARLSSLAEVQPLSSVARLMAERMTQSWTTVPHFFVVREVDASALVSARERLTSMDAVKPTHTDLLTALVARTLLKHPKLNASWTGNGIRLNKDINLALAMAVEGGVVAAVIQHADTAGVLEIAAQRRELTDRARTGRLRPSDISGATFTISNLGMFNVDAFSAIITPPQAAVLALGRISDRVVPVDGRPGIRPMMTMTLSCDHRVASGDVAAAFLNDLAEGIGRADIIFSH